MKEKSKKIIEILANTGCLVFPDNYISYKLLVNTVHVSKPGEEDKFSHISEIEKIDINRFKDVLSIMKSLSDILEDTEEIDLKKLLSLLFISDLDQKENDIERIDYVSSFIEIESILLENKLNQEELVKDNELDMYDMTQDDDESDDEFETESEENIEINNTIMEIMRRLQY
jgi:hypothetical protein